MKKAWFIVIAALLLFAHHTAIGQSFKWVKGGGSTDVISSGNNEAVYFMCTDANNNIYALSNVGFPTVFADTFVGTPVYGNNNNILITSYNCSGQMRWAKMITSPNECIPTGMVSDSLGNIYVSGYFEHMTGTAPLSIGHDTAITAFSYLSVGLIQLDTIGHFRWFRYVGNNSFTTASGVSYRGAVLAMDAFNDVHFFNYMKSGVPIMPGDTSHYGVYDLKYNTAGTLLSAVRLDLDSQWFLRGAVIDPATNKLYVCGEINTSIGGWDTSFVAAFDASHNLLWKYDAYISGTGITGITLDQSKHIHISADAGSSTSSATIFVFNNDTVTNTHYPVEEMSLIMTLDTNGHPEWVKKFDGSTAINDIGYNSINQLNNNKVTATGGFCGTITDGVISLVTPVSGVTNPFLEIVDSAGDLVTIQQIYGDGINNAGTAITSDKVGNIYIGGQVEDSIWAVNGTTPIPAYHSNGGNTDFFIMKYGVDCDCTTMPVASFTDTGSHTVEVFYTGTTAGLDSIVWNFGDGTHDTGMTALHTYTDSGTFRICVRVYTTCGSDLFCKNVVIHLPIEVRSTEGVERVVRVYPNPVKDELVIDGVQENTHFRLQNAIGVQLQHGNLHQIKDVISVEGYPSGLYLLELTDTNGIRNIIKIIKE